MLSAEDKEMLEGVLEYDRLQKQLLDELVESFVDDPNGITVGTCDILVELLSVINYVPNDGMGFRVSNPTSDGRVFLELNKVG